MMTLPFSIFEKYMLLDDTPAYPMDSFRFLRFSGQLNFDKFETSVTETIRYQPLLRSIARKNGSRHFTWEETESPPFIRRIRGSLATPYPSPEAIDLFNEPGFKIYFVEERNNNCCSVLFQFHHSVSDGLGEMEVISDILNDYHIRSQGGMPPKNPRKVDASLLPLRGSSGLTLAKYFRYYFPTAVTTRQLLFRTPMPLAPHVPLNTNIRAKDYLAFCSDELTVEETKNYFNSAKPKKVTINDLLLRDLFLTIGEWRTKWVAPTDHPWLRISMPMSLRTEIHQQIPASNSVTMLFLDRKEGDFGDSEQLLQGIHRETEWIKRTEQKHVLLLSLRIRDLLPGGIKRTLKSKYCRATSVLSNLGRVFEMPLFPRREDGRLKIGSAVLEEVDAMPPIRFGTLISLSALTYANRLRLILRYDSKNMTTEQATDLLQIYFSHVKQSSGLSH